jgi:hypothetical protein
VADDGVEIVLKVVDRLGREETAVVDLIQVERKVLDPYNLLQKRERDVLVGPDGVLGEGAAEELKSARPSSPSPEGTKRRRSIAQFSSSRTNAGDVSPALSHPWPRGRASFYQKGSSLARRNPTAGLKGEVWLMREPGIELDGHCRSRDP